MSNRKPNSGKLEDQKKDVMISIKGISNANQNEDVVELLTSGLFYRGDNSFLLSYNESETTGFAGHKTTLKIEDKRVIMNRTGKTNSQLVVEKGCRHQCNYDTGYGSITVGVSGIEISSTLSDEGGEVDFSYEMDINTALACENRVIIKVEPDIKNED